METPLHKNSLMYCTLHNGCITEVDKMEMNKKMNSTLHDAWRMIEGIKHGDDDDE